MGVRHSSGFVEVEVKPVDRPGGSRSGRGRRDKAVWRIVDRSPATGGVTKIQTSRHGEFQLIKTISGMHRAIPLDSLSEDDTIGLWRTRAHCQGFTSRLLAKTV
jgi:hypothetical protein